MVTAIPAHLVDDGLAVRRRHRRDHMHHATDRLQRQVVGDRDEVIGIGASLHVDRVARLGRRNRCGDRGVLLPGTHREDVAGARSAECDWNDVVTEWRQIGQRDGGGRTDLQCKIPSADAWRLLRDRDEIAEAGIAGSSALHSWPAIGTSIGAASLVGTRPGMTVGSIVAERHPWFVQDTYRSHAPAGVNQCCRGVSLIIPVPCVIRRSDVIETNI